MPEQNQDQSTEELRDQVREAASEWASIEFKPSERALDFCCRIRDFSSSGLGMLVSKESEVIKHIKVGDTFPVRYHEGRATPEPMNLKVRISHITRADDGREDYMIVGLSILERLQKSSN